MFQKDLLSKQDAITLLELIHKSHFCETDEDLKKIMNEFNCLLPYDFATFVLASLNNNNVGTFRIVNVNYPTEWLQLYTQRKYELIDPIVKVNFTEFKLQYWGDTYKRESPQKNFLSLAEDFGLENGYSYGLKDFKKSKGSLLSLAGKSLKDNPRTRAILDLMMPCFHEVVSRILILDYKKKILPLSPRERDILTWIIQGKGTWDISVILAISERTVKFHVKNIMQKLDAVNRLQAGAIAVEYGLVDID